MPADAETKLAINMYPMIASLPLFIAANYSMESWQQD
jgi:hypothetical protein